MMEIRIGDTVTMCGHQLKLLRIENDSIVYEVLNKKGPNKINSYGLRDFEEIAELYDMELIKEEDA